MRSSRSRRTISLISKAMHRVRDRLVARRTSVIWRQPAVGLPARAWPGLCQDSVQAKAAAMPEILEERQDANLTPRMRRTSSACSLERVERPGATDRRDERRGGTDRLFRSSLPTTQADPRHRSLGCDRDRRRNRQRLSLSQGPGVLLLAGTCAATALDRRQGKALRHQQARGGK